MRERGGDDCVADAEPGRMELRVEGRCEDVGREAGVGELDKREAPTAPRSSVLDEHDFLEPSASDNLLRRATADARQGRGDLGFGRERIEAAQEEDTARSGANIASPVVHVKALRGGPRHRSLIFRQASGRPLVVAPPARLLTVVDLDPHPVVRSRT